MLLEIPSLLWSPYTIVLIDLMESSSRVLTCQSAPLFFFSVLEILVSVTFGSFFNHPEKFSACSCFFFQQKTGARQDYPCCEVPMNS